MVTSQALFLALLAALGLERLFELSLSARHARAAFARGAVETGQRHYRVMAALHALFFVSCAVEVLWRRPPFHPALAVLGLTGLVCSMGLRYWAIHALGERWNTRILVLPGEPPVTGGPYRYLRHPNYLAVVMELACVPLIHTALFTAVAFSLANAAVLFVRIRAEEAALGERYQRAFAGKRRFWPAGQGRGL